MSSRIPTVERERRTLTERMREAGELLGKGPTFIITEWPRALAGLIAGLEKATAPHDLEAALDGLGFSASVFSLGLLRRCWCHSCDAYATNKLRSAEWQEAYGKTLHHYVSQLREHPPAKPPPHAWVIRRSRDDFYLSEVGWKLGRPFAKRFTSRAVARNRAREPSMVAVGARVVGVRLTK